MVRIRGGTNISHSKEEKLALVLHNLAGKTAQSLEREKRIYHARPLNNYNTKYFNYIKPVRKLKRKLPVQYKFKQAV